MQIAYNRSKRNEKIKYIVVHDTGNRAKGADAQAHFNYFNSGDRQSSADFFVDDNVALQVNNYNKYYTWHCGDGKGRNGITNGNSVGVEICINSDGDYEKAKRKAAETVKSLMKELSVPLERVVRHFDVSGKNCPQTFSKKDWEEFKGMLIEEYTSINDIVWELANRGIVTDKEGMLKEMSENPDGRLYWLARKMLHIIRVIGS